MDWVNKTVTTFLTIHLSSLFPHVTEKDFYLWMMSVNHIFFTPSIYLSVFVCKKKHAILKKDRKGKRLPELSSPLTSITMSANKIQNENLAQGDEVTGWSIGERHPHTDFFTPITPHGEISSLSLFNAPDHCINTVCFTRLRPALYQWQNYWNGSPEEMLEIRLICPCGSAREFLNDAVCNLWQRHWCWVGLM